MVKRFSEAASLLWNNLGLFTAVILTVWLPGNILTNIIPYLFNDDSGVLFIRMTIWIEGIFGPIYIGALVYALYNIKMGKRVTYGEAIAVGFRKWGHLFIARFVAGILTVLGLIALIVPGIILVVRYSLLDAAVIIENKGISEARVRSIELTAGRRWQILISAILLFVPFLLLSFFMYLPFGLFDSPYAIPFSIVVDCLLDVVFAVIQITIFLFYWEAIQTSAVAETVVETDGASAVIQP